MSSNRVRLPTRDLVDVLDLMLWAFGECHGLSVTAWQKADDDAPCHHPMEDVTDAKVSGCIHPDAFSIFLLK